MEISKTYKEMEDWKRSLNCLYLEVDASIAEDVDFNVSAKIKSLTVTLQEHKTLLKEFHLHWGILRPGLTVSREEYLTVKKIDTLLQKIQKLGE